MAADEHKSPREVDHDLAEKAEALEDQIKQAEAKHPLQDGEPLDDAAGEDKPPPEER
jgi:hypothetical protein